MVKSKNKKSVIALVVMAFLLVASIVLAATGAWFTDKASGTGSADVTFGKVDVGVTGTATLTKAHTGTLTVDGCSWSISGLTLENSSTVDIYYAYTVTVEVSGDDLTETEKGYFTVTNSNAAVECEKLTAGTAFSALKGMSVAFDSKGVMNGSSKTATITVTVKVAAIQADHIEEEAAKTQLATLLTSGD